MEQQIQTDLSVYQSGRHFDFYLYVHHNIKKEERQFYLDTVLYKFTQETETVSCCNPFRYKKSDRNSIGVPV